MARLPCSHLATTTNIPISTILNSKEYLKCSDCDFQGPNLWICLHKNCLQIGCPEKANDHSTIHNDKNPSHCVHMNLSSQRIWCYECKREVFFESNIYNDSDQETESYAGEPKDSGRGSYSTLHTNTPDRGVVFENSVGLNVGMSGDGYVGDSSDNDDDYSQDSRPVGLLGLQNIGNTCYMNAALQALSNTEPLTRFFLDCPYVVHVLFEGKKPGLSRTYQALMKDIWVKRENKGYVTPSGILYGIRAVHATFRGYHQHDTQEFLRNFMDQLHEELKRPVPPDCCPLLANDADTFSMTVDGDGMSTATTTPSVGQSLNYVDSSEGEEYETCDSGVSERSSLSDDTERPVNNCSVSAKRRLSRCSSPNRRQRQRVQSTSSVIDSQPGASSSTSNSNKKQIKYRSIISDIFDGKLLSSVQCLTCDRISCRVETFQDLSLPIPSRDHLVLLHGRTAAAAAAASAASAGGSGGIMCSDAVIPSMASDGAVVGWIAWIFAWLRSWFYGPMVTLHDCLAAFFSTDELKGDNMYSCERCSKLRNGIKFSKVLQLPEVLCIHLKRFRHELMFSSKISAAVSFPLKGLDMKPYLHKDCISKVSTYDLYSVICHHGTAGGGHYTCFALNSGQWYEFDDQCVTKVSADRVQTCEAYVLFYRKTQNTAEVVRNKVTDMLESCNEEMKKTYISKQWINRFYYCAEPGPIDNTDFLCRHGAINPDLIIEHFACVVPLDVYEYLHKKFGGCPPLTNLTVCHACTALQKRLLLEMETYLQISRDAHAQEVPPTHYLSTTWYNQWHNFVQERNQEPPGPIDNTKIDPNNPDLSEAADVPECIWNFFYNIYGGGPEIRIKPPVVETTESEGGMPTPCEEPTDSTENQSSIPTAYDFMPVRHMKEIPKIDKKSYWSGEPMDTETPPTDNCVDIDADGTKTENTTVHNFSDMLLLCNYTEDKNSASSNVDDDIDDAESTEFRNKSKRHRRRRKNLASV